MDFNENSSFSKKIDLREDESFKALSHLLDNGLYHSVQLLIDNGYKVKLEHVDKLTSRCYESSSDEFKVFLLDIINSLDSNDLCYNDGKGKKKNKYSELLNNSSVIKFNNLGLSFSESTIKDLHNKDVPFVLNRTFIKEILSCEFKKDFLKEDLICFNSISSLITDNFECIINRLDDPEDIYCVIEDCSSLFNIGIMPLLKYTFTESLYLDALLSSHRNTFEMFNDNLKKRFPDHDFKINELQNDLNISLAYKFIFNSAKYGDQCFPFQQDKFNIIFNKKLSSKNSIYSKLDVLLHTCLEVDANYIGFFHNFDRLFGTDNKIFKGTKNKTINSMVNEYFDDFVCSKIESLNIDVFEREFTESIKFVTQNLCKIKKIFKDDFDIVIDINPIQKAILFKDSLNNLSETCDSNRYGFKVIDSMLEDIRDHAPIPSPTFKI